MPANLRGAWRVVSHNDVAQIGKLAMVDDVTPPSPNTWRFTNERGQSVMGQLVGQKLETVPWGSARVVGPGDGDFLLWSGQLSTMWARQSGP